MRARAPASTANLGPGFDTLALALSLYVDVEVVSADRLVVRSTGEGAELPADASHLAARVALEVVGHDRLAITVSSEIPVGRGLGSSAALAVATAAACGARDPLGVGVAVDGHPENAAASVAGGLVAATMVRGVPRVTSLDLDRGLAFVVLVPERPLPTARARRVLPTEVPMADATFNLGRLAMLVAGLGDRRRLSHEATEDRLHQDYRSALFPEAPMALSRLAAAGARATCWSGAGPSILGICDIEDAEGVRARGEAILKEAGVSGQALLLEADRVGLTTERTLGLH